MHHSSFLNTDTLRIHTPPEGASSSNLIAQHIPASLSIPDIAYLDELLLGIQLARGHAPDEVLNLLTNKVRTKIGGTSGNVDELELPIAYGSFDELDEDGDVLKVFPSHYADCHFRVRKNYDWLSLSSYIRLPGNNDWGVYPYEAQCLISIPCAALSQTLCTELGHLLCDIAQRLALKNPSSQAD